MTNKIIDTEQREEHINDNIISIGMSENLIAVKRICRQLENRGFEFEVPNKYLDKFLKKGMDEVKRLIGDDDKFPVYALLKEKGTKKFFEEIVMGKKDIAGVKKLAESEEKKRESLETKIYKCKNKGKYEEAMIYEYQLNSFNNPDEFIRLLKNELVRLEKLGIEDNLDEYELKSEELKKLTRIKERRYKNSESYNFVKLLEYDLREYVGSLLFKKNGRNSKSEERFLRTYYGDIVVDFEHLLLLYYYMLNINHKHINKIKGLLYYKAIETFYEEVVQVKDAKPSSTNIKPSFDIGADTFGWKRFSQYTRKYMLYFMQPVDYDCYYIEVDNLAQIGFLISREVDVLDYATLVEKFIGAKNIIDNQEGGIFFNFLSKEQENLLLPYILTENFPMWHMDGDYKEDLVDGFMTRQHKLGNEVDMYNRTIKPYSLDMVGSIIYNKLYNLENLIDKDLAYIYYVSPQRIGVAVKKDLEECYIDEIFGPVKHMLNRVEEPKLEDVVLGKWL